MEQIQNNRVITDLYRENAQFPGIALDGSDVYLCWQRFVDRHDSLMASCRRGDEVVWEREISDGGEVLHPVILAHGGAIWYAWSEYARENWRILARCYRDGQWGEVLTVASGEALFFPRLFTWQGRLHVIWTEQHKGSAAAVLCPLTEAGPGAAETVSAVGEAYRAGAAEGGDGNLYVAYDGFDGKQYKLFARARTAAGWSKEIVVSQGEDWASTPWIAAKPDGAVVGWYDYGYMAVYSVRSADLTVRDGALAAVNPQCLKEGVDWYLDLHVASNASGLQAMAYTRSKYDVLVCTRRGSEPWSRPVLMSYGDGHCGVHPKLLVDEDDTIHLMWQFGFKNGHMERNAQVIYNHLTPTELAQQPDYVAPPSDFTQPIPANADKRLDEHPADVVRAWLDKNGYGNLSVYFGDIHGQSGLSDGMGEVDQYYHRARDKARLDEVFESYHPTVVFHAAAHKHVPLMEISPAEAVKNNVFGTKNLLTSASEHGVERLVQLSTDKAVNPTSVMGCTKRLCEMLIQTFAGNTDMKCVAVRFGNVLGSHGSVIPLFEAQIKKGGPVTLTDANIERYFMTIPEAAQLVLQAGALAESGSIYVLDMGEPVKIMDLAKQLIRFYGYEPGVNMDIKIVGLRPGEKLYEELMMDEEQDKMRRTVHNKIFVAPPRNIDLGEFYQQLQELAVAAEHNDDSVVEQLAKMVPTFTPTRENLKL